MAASCGSSSSVCVIMFCCSLFRTISPRGELRICSELVLRKREKRYLFRGGKLKTKRTLGIQRRHTRASRHKRKGKKNIHVQKQGGGELPAFFLELAYLNFRVSTLRAVEPATEKGKGRTRGDEERRMGPGVGEGWGAKLRTATPQPEVRTEPSLLRLSLYIDAEPREEGRLTPSCWGRRTWPSWSRPRG